MMDSDKYYIVRTEEGEIRGYSLEDGKKIDVEYRKMMKRLKHPSVSYLQGKNICKNFKRCVLDKFDFKVLKEILGPEPIFEILSSSWKKSEEL